MAGGPLFPAFEVAAFVPTPSVNGLTLLYFRFTPFPTPRKQPEEIAARPP